MSHDGRKVGLRFGKRSALKVKLTGKSVPTAGKRPSPVKRGYRGCRWQPRETSGHKDAVLCFGKLWKADPPVDEERRKVSYLAASDPGYLKWMIAKHNREVTRGEHGFPNELVDVMIAWLARRGIKVKRELRAPRAT